MTDETTPNDPLEPPKPSYAGGETEGSADPSADPAAPGREAEEAGGTSGFEPPTEPTETLQPEPPRKRRLTRSRDDRMIAGVAGGLARYFAVDPLIVRIGFAISVFFGGLGALAYIALALFVPVGDDDGQPAGKAPVENSRALAIGVGIGVIIIALSWGIFDGDFIFGFGVGDGDGWFFLPFLLLVAAFIYVIANRRNAPVGENAPPGERSPGRSILTIAGGIVLAFFAMGALGVLALGSAWAGATGHGVAVGGAIVAIGALLALSAFRGSGARWLIVPAVALAAPLGAVSAADIEFGDGIGNREYTPSTVESLPEDGYELGVGQLTVDLRDLDWEADTVAALDVDLGIGQAIVAVPENVCVSADLDATAGAIDFAGSESDGIDAEIDTPEGSPPRLDLTGEVDLGEFRVVNDDDAEIEELQHGRRRFGNLDSEDLPGDAELDARMDAACAAVDEDQGPDVPDSRPDAAPDPSAPGREAEEAGGTSSRSGGK